MGVANSMFNTSNVDIVAAGSKSSNFIASGPLIFNGQCPAQVVFIELRTRCETEAFRSSQYPLSRIDLCDLHTRECIPTPLWTAKGHFILYAIIT